MAGAFGKDQGGLGKIREVCMAVVKLRDGERTDEARKITEDRPYWALRRCRKTISSFEQKNNRT